MARALYPVLAVVLALAGLGASFMAEPQVAARGTEVQLDAQQRALRSAKRAAAEASRRSVDLEREAARMREDADRLRGRALAVAARIQEAEANIEASQARISIIAQMQRQQRARLAEKQVPIARLTAALQSLARRPVVLTLVQPGSIDDMVHVRSVMSTVLPEVEVRTAELRAEVGRGRQLRARAEQAAKMLRTDRSELASRRDQLARLEQQRRVESARLASSSLIQDERAIALGEEASDITDLMSRISDAGKVREQLAALEGPVLRPAKPGESRTPPERTGTRGSRQPAYRLPVIGRVVAGLGEVSQNGVRSRGLTLATRPEAQIVAPADGRAGFAGPYRGFGDILIIEHGGGWTSLITGMERVDVEVGDQLVQGEPLGISGKNNARITVELRRNGRPIDIAALLAG